MPEEQPSRLVEICHFKEQLSLSHVFVSNYFIYYFLYISSTSAKTLVILVKSSFFVITLKFEKFPPSWFIERVLKETGNNSI